MDQGKLFPETELRKGSRGPAVMFLKLWLIGTGYSSGLIPDDVYDDQTVDNVRNLQEDHNAGSFVHPADRVEISGNLDAKTRVAIKRKYEFDLNVLPMPPNPEVFAMRSRYIGPNGVGTESVSNDAPASGE